MYVVSDQFDPAIILDETEHSIHFSGFVATIDSELDLNQATECSLFWRYNICYKNNILNEDGVKEQIEVFVNYMANK